MKHPKTPELLKKVKADQEERERKTAEWAAREKEARTEREYRRWMKECHGEGEEFDWDAFKKKLQVVVPKTLVELSEEEKELDSITKHETEIRKIRSFFRSKWYASLADVDGSYVLRKLEEEFPDEGSRVPGTDQTAG